nr:hypothetical protein [Tanacetum cinerariifolium]
MDKKLQGYAARSAENKRRMETNPRDNSWQQPPFKSKCKLHHEGLCTIWCGNYKKVGHQTRDCRVTVNPNTQGAAVKNQQGNEVTTRAYAIGRGGTNPDSNVVTEERIRLLVGSPGASTTLIYSQGSSSTPIYSSGSSSTLISSSGSSRNAECSNCKHFLDKTMVLEAMMDMYMHPEQHTVNSTSLFHEVYNNMGKLDLE